MTRSLPLRERLIVAADFRPDELVGPYGKDRGSVRKQVLRLADELYGMGVFLKVNSALRACGYTLIDEIHARGLKVFADLKLFDIKETLAIDGVLLHEAKPELLTVVAATGIQSMHALKDELPDTELLAVTVLTSFSDDDTRAMFTVSTEEAVERLAHIASSGGVNGFISSPKEAAMLRAKFGVALSVNTPAVRPEWAIVPGDDQNPERVMTPGKAIAAGADRIVVGRPITWSSQPREAVDRTLAEIADAIA